MQPMKQLFATALLCLSLSATAQKRMASYPFEFERPTLSREDYDAYFLSRPADSSFALVLKDNKKVEYVLMDKKFKTVAKIPSALNSTVFGEKVVDYAGGTANALAFYFVYSGKDHYIETVDFASKTVSHKKLVFLQQQSVFCPHHR
jgi:hypothetical protein